MNLYLSNLAIVLGLLTILWIISLPLRDASLIDPFWSLGFVLIAWRTFWSTSNHQHASGGDWLILLTTTIWGLRLALYLFWRNHGKGEDRRYAAMRQSFGPGFWFYSYPVVFLLQGCLMWIISFPIQVGLRAESNSPPGLITLVGVAIYLVGLFFESVGDWQLARFRTEPTNGGRVMDRGLWRYTRHPNYFGDFCVWWGIYLMAVDLGAWWTIFSPILMSILLLRVSGVTLLEKEIRQRRPEYDDYVRRTSSFFPFPPRGK